VIFGEMPSMLPGATAGPRDFLPDGGRGVTGQPALASTRRAVTLALFTGASMA
jgi:hypothetical protein